MNYLGSLYSASTNREFTNIPSKPNRTLESRATTTPTPHSISVPRSQQQRQRHHQHHHQHSSRAFPATGLVRSSNSMSKPSNGTIHSPPVVSRQHTVSRPEPEPSLKSKPSIADLIGRLTTPTISSRQKMRSPTRSTSGASPTVRSPKLNSPGKRSVSQNDVIISRPIPIPKQVNPTGRTLGSNSPEVQLASRKKAHSPPQIDTKLVNGKSRAASGVKPAENGTRNFSNESSDSMSSARNYRTPVMETPAQFDTPDYLRSDTETPVRPLNSTPTKPSTEKSGKSVRVDSKNISKTAPSSTSKNSTASSSTTQSKQRGNLSSPLSLQSGPVSPIKMSPAPLSPDPTPPKLAPINSPDTKPGSKTRHIDINASSYLGHKRRLSAPAPAANMTTPRAMSQASSIKGRVASPPVSPTDKDNNLTRSTSSSDEAKKPLNSVSAPTTENGKNEHKRNLGGTESSSESIKPIPAGSDKSAKTMHTAPNDVVQLKEQNKKLKTTNRLLKSRLEDLLSNHDQISAELAICEASRNSLEQQVKGYESVQREMERKLDIYRRELTKANKKEGNLRTQIQELKISLEEKNIENYTLSRQQNK